MVRHRERDKKKRLFWKLVDRGPIKFIKAKRRPHVSTNDLDQDRNLEADYLEKRKQRKEEEGL